MNLRLQFIGLILCLKTGGERINGKQNTGDYRGIGGDTTKLTTALKGVNSEIRNTQSQLRDVEKLLKLNPGNTELLSQKQRLLNEEVQATKEKLEALKTASEQSAVALQKTGVKEGLANGKPRTKKRLKA